MPASNSIPRSLARRFRVLRPLGAGASGAVFLVRDRARRPAAMLALKIIGRRLRAGDQAAFRREFDLLRRLRHPGIVPVEDFGETGGTVWFTSEWIPGGDIFSASAAWTDADLRRALGAMASTLGFLHEQGVLHNDLKAS